MKLLAIGVLCRRRNRWPDIVAAIVDMRQIVG